LKQISVVQPHCLGHCSADSTFFGQLRHCQGLKSILREAGVAIIVKNSVEKPFQFVLSSLPLGNIFAMHFQFCHTGKNAEAILFLSDA